MWTDGFIIFLRKFEIGTALSCFCNQLEMFKMDTTGKSLVEHRDWAATKGVMNKNTAGALRAACTQVLGVLDDWQDVDVTTIDAEDVVQRFKNLRAKDFKPESLETYGARFKKALSSYVAYTRDPGAWKPTRQSKLRSPRPNGNGAAGSAHTHKLRRRVSLSSRALDLSTTPSRYATA